MKRELKELILEGKIKSVHEKLLELCDADQFENYVNAILLNRVRYGNLRSFLQNGLLSIQEYELALNKCILALIEIIDKISMETNTPLKFRPSAKNRGVILHDNEITEKSIIEGTVYLTEKPDAQELIRTGQRIKKGDLVYLLEAMKRYNYVYSSYNGTIKRIYVQNGQRIKSNGIVYILEIAPEDIVATSRSNIEQVDLDRQRDFTAFYAPVFGKKRTIESYVLLNPLDGTLVLPDINRLISFSTRGIKQGECIYQVEHNAMVFDIISPFECKLDIVMASTNTQKVVVGASMYNVTKDT